MKGMRIAIVAAIFVTWPAVYAQNMVEYSTLATKSATLPNAIAATSHAVTKKAAALEANLTGDTGKQLPADGRAATDHQQPGSGSTPPAIFILCNGDRLEPSHYVLTVNSLQLQQGETHRTIPLTAINLDATAAANRERGIDLKFPKNKSEIMLSF